MTGSHHRRRSTDNFGPWLYGSASSCVTGQSMSADGVLTMR